MVVQLPRGEYSRSSDEILDASDWNSIRFIISAICGQNGYGLEVYLAGLPVESRVRGRTSTSRTDCGGFTKVRTASRVRRRFRSDHIKPQSSNHPKSLSKLFLIVSSDQISSDQIGPLDFPSPAFLPVHGPYIQKSGVAGGRHFAPSLPSCAIQRGANSFF
jgi:hypothetical protein